MKTKTKFISAACVAALALWAPLPASAQFSATTSPTASPAASPAAKAPRPVSFHGKINSVDQTAKTFTIGKEKIRVIKITDTTVITKDGNPGTMTDVAADENVGGSYWKREDGSLEAKTVNLGQKKSGKKKKEKAESESMASPSPTASPKAKP